jgi:hypothetical protein
MEWFIMGSHSRYKWRFYRIRITNGEIVYESHKRHVLASIDVGLYNSLRRREALAHARRGSKRCAQEHNKK